MQDANTDDLVFSVAQLIEYCSQFYLVNPSDVIIMAAFSAEGHALFSRVLAAPC